ncbi:MAG: group III truncated hemoglobin [Sediminibacterium sp.]|jgi:hemoglobin|nr:group III truncated hemoglobin [Hydrotalea sp.]MCU0336239.1 group III truncated hemoglobin [Sediminibacterium sp.]
MKTDIENRSDIEHLVNSFYSKVKRDEMLAPFFGKVAKINWKQHLPVMYNFWENAVFHTGTYHGNPMEVHRQLSAKKSLSPVHFKRWLELFITTVDDLYGGNNAENIKQRAISIATVMQIKLIS